MVILVRNQEKAKGMLAAALAPQALETRRELGVADHDGRAGDAR